MISLNGRSWPHNPPTASPSHPASRRQFLLQLSTVLALLALGTIIVYMTGGTGYAFPYVLLVPVVLASAWYGLPASLITAAAAGLLLGPLMPLDVGAATAQPLGNWIARLLMFVLIGTFTGWMFQRLRRANQAQARALRTDSRTGLPNQAALDADLAALLARQARGHAEDCGVALVFVRILDLAEVLEALGTDASDQVVASVAARIADHSDQSVQSYRFSGSEILFLLPTPDSAQVAPLVEAVRQAGEEIMEVRDVPVRVQMAIGSHYSNDLRVAPEELVRRARTAVEEAEFYRPYDPAFERRSSERVQLISRIRSGLKAGEFELHYQPKIDLITNRPAGAEALLRWRAVDGRLIMPDSFMPKLEDTSLIAPVTRFVLQQALEFLRQHPEEQLSINFAVRNLFDKALIRDLPKLAQASQVDPGRLEIEITEGALIRNPHGARLILQELRNHGFPVSLDDFGTGYSSFEYLTHLPITGLKIDRAFVRDLESAASSRTVMKCLIEMAQALDLWVVAEGIETEGQCRILRELDCDLGQGYLFGRPMTAKSYLLWRQTDLS